jgi:hypothetical protein
MQKIAVFVEGQTELITVREFLKKKYTYEVDILCLELYKNSFQTVPYENKNPNSKQYYQIHNIGNDKRVLSAIIEREKSFWEAGFIKLIGLRDMYSKEYKDANSPSQEINSILNIKVIEETKKIVDASTNKPNKIKVCFSVMEIEAWFLGMYKFFERYNPKYSAENINAALGVDISKIDPEKTFFHPSLVLDKVFSIDGKRYKKRESNVEAILNQLQNEDFEELYSSPKCSSFIIFHDELIVAE